MTTTFDFQDGTGWWCPACGKKPKTVDTPYGVKRTCCGLWGWGKNAPLVDSETHQARQYAHRVFDGLWQSGLVSRSQAYTMLAQELSIDPSDCHMKLMDRATAQRVPQAAHTRSGNESRKADMQTWTLLLITALGGPLDGERTGLLLYPSEAACLAAHRTISAGIGYDHQIACEPTGILSSSTRPKQRPENLK